jgi:hypothetical protein
MMDKAKTMPDLSQFNGSETLYRHSFGVLNVTEGMLFVANEVGAHWLIDVAASVQKLVIRKERQLGLRDFQVWQIVSKDGKATVECWSDKPHDSGSEKLYDQDIPMTDFPEGTFQFWVIEGTCLLPGEY